MKSARCLKQFKITTVDRYQSAQDAALKNCCDKQTADSGHISCNTQHKWYSKNLEIVPYQEQNTWNDRQPELLSSGNPVPLKNKYYFHCGQTNDNPQLDYKKIFHNDSFHLNTVVASKSKKPADADHW